jgi:hypothetical protein
VQICGRIDQGFVGLFNCSTRYCGAATDDGHGAVLGCIKLGVVQVVDAHRRPAMEDIGLDLGEARYEKECLLLQPLKNAIVQCRALSRLCVDGGVSVVRRFIFSMPIRSTANRSNIIPDD